MVNAMHSTEHHMGVGGYTPSLLAVTASVWTAAPVRNCLPGEGSLFASLKRLMRSDRPAGLQGKMGTIGRLYGYWQTGSSAMYMYMYERHIHRVAYDCNCQLAVAW